MIRNLVTLLAGVPALWLSIYVFGWIVTGDIEFPGLRVKREGHAWRFWASITGLGLLSMALLCLAVTIFLGLILPGRL